MLKKSPLIISTLLASNVLLASGNNTNPRHPRDPIPMEPLIFLQDCFPFPGEEAKTCDEFIREGINNAYPLVKDTQGKNYYKQPSQTIKNKSLPKLQKLVNQEFQTFDTIDNINNNDFECDDNETSPTLIDKDLQKINTKCNKVKTKGLVWLVQHQPAKKKLCKEFTGNKHLPFKGFILNDEERTKNEIAITKFMYASLGMPTSLMVSRNRQDLMPVYDNEPRGILSFIPIKDGSQSPSNVLIPQNTQTKSYTKPLEFNNPKNPISSPGSLAWTNKDTDCETNNCLMRVCLNKTKDTQTPGSGFIIDNKDTTCDNTWTARQITSWNYYIDNHDDLTNSTWPKSWVKASYYVDQAKENCSHSYSSLLGEGSDTYCFPWTGIGNTYNWKTQNWKDGYNEYVIPANSKFNFNASSFTFTPLSEINTQLKMNFWCNERDTQQTGKYTSYRYY